MTGNKNDRVSELERLASLRASGALTEDEFAKAKSRVIQGGRTGKFVSCSILALVAGLLGAGAYYVKGGQSVSAESVESPPEQVAATQPIAQPIDTPACDDADVQQKVVELANEQARAEASRIRSDLGPMGAAMLGNSDMPRLLAVHNVRTIFHHEQSGFRACSASGELNKGSLELGFTIEWHDKQKGEYLVQMDRVAYLKAQYGQSGSPTVEN